jgi:hypothetical protein
MHSRIQNMLMYNLFCFYSAPERKPTRKTSGPLPPLSKVKRFQATKCVFILQQIYVQGAFTVFGAVFQLSGALIH